MSLKHIRHHKTFRLVALVLIFQFFVSQIPVYAETNIQYQLDSSGVYQSTKQKVQKLGVSNFILKPFDLNEFVAVIQKNLIN